MLFIVELMVNFLYFIIGDMLDFEKKVLDMCCCVDISGVFMSGGQFLDYEEMLEYFVLCKWSKFFF